MFGHRPRLRRREEDPASRYWRLGLFRSIRHRDHPQVDNGEQTTEDGRDRAGGGNGEQAATAAGRA
ncbi:hypothetical protein BN6_65490 [Saccharothrix espanaensis DSM 44229]|uniref:Uncharacterized protein n=1 Tax=Saccharothrix espanaensis (strain ATCC 51144 / DSM 44229 / JCM 9112 / NBRC 15066 / NRRL 15764) TaxID=1179773 RepID=K0K8C3_SACES|nr:hypothetical protein BN6_65490 [Saccharothrix espanaensis DSM 44229]